jgi:Mycothiol maleylpyruvate isomerase N-terminal domain
VTAATTTTTDLRRAPLADVRSVDLRRPERDLWADEAALYDRLVASWAGLDDAAWHLPGAAPSDAGGPDWSLGEHVGHIADWQEVAIGFTAHAVETGEWPSDSDFEGGDFDRYNERTRAPWTTMPRDAILAMLGGSRRGLVQQARRLTDEAIRGHGAWGWVYLALHGHYLDHLGIAEAWGDTLRVRQTDGDLFVADPRPVDHAAFVAADDAIAADLDSLLKAVPGDRWDAEAVTPGWTLRDHVAHLADWMEEGVRAVDGFQRGNAWPADPDEGVDAWNERMVSLTRGSDVRTTPTRYRAARAALLAKVSTLTTDELRSADGWSWTYDCLYGHTRKHLALLGPWCVRQGWPPLR